MVSASPVATWFELSSKTRTAKSMEESAPPAAAPRMPSHGLKVETVTPKPQMAPISIMPSTPRLSTPAFSTTSSPSAASRIGVVRPTIVTMAAMMNSVLMDHSPAAGSALTFGLPTKRTR